MNHHEEDITAYRYERKFLVHGISAKEIESSIKLHPAAFREVFHERTINNIYFDTPGFNNYYDNVEGEKDRWKARIRWYGELFGEIAKPVLEFKIKRGLLGTKESYKLAPFTFNNDFTGAVIADMIKRSQLPLHVADLFRGLKPTLLNRYRRKYFLSADKQFRVTIDMDLTYYGISTLQNTFINRSSDRNTVVIELKYNYEADTIANSISTLFPFMLTKSSKYLQGLERVMM